MNTQLRQYICFLTDGSQLGDLVMGHEIKTDDPLLFQIVRFTAGENQPRIVASCNRATISAIIDVTEIADNVE